jgi:hypothetical protein
MSMEPSVEAFWNEFERETGEKVLAKTMCQCFSSPKDRGDWGLLVLSPSSIRFRRTAGENWFSSIFKASSSEAPKKIEEDLRISLDAIQEVSRPEKKVLDFLFGSPFLSISIRYGPSDNPMHIRFAVDPKSDILRLLEEKVEKKSR